MVEFDAAFHALTGHPPFPWQRALYERFARGDFPASCTLPTGLGKTNVLAVWLVALANHPDVVPRRLVYVVNRRTVVDQTTVEAEKFQGNAAKAGVRVPAISTLRGQYADNREWSADPSRPAIICGTVDMIGSRLLFGGYGLGFKSRPLHAGFLGQDVLLVHDEAHLEPAFQKLLAEIEAEQKRCTEFRRFHVIELSATSRGHAEPFVLTPEDYANDTVKERVNAQKAITLHRNADTKKLADELAALAVKRTGAVLVFTQKVEDVEGVCKKLPKGKFEKLTGTLRGRERDGLVTKPIFQRFLPGAAPSDEPAFLVCTSAGEVGVNISADHLVCDLSTFDSMAQRFGRVNRFGLRPAHIDVVHPTAFDDDDPTEVRRRRTLALLEQLQGDGSPKALGDLPPGARQDAFAVEPTLLDTSDILFDAWALTTVRDKLPGRPKVEPYLHGVPDKSELPETSVAWRQEVTELDPKYTDDDSDADRRKKRARFEKYAAELLEDYPLKPHELLREPSHRAFKHLTALAERHPTLFAWLVDDDGAVQHLTLRDLADKDRKDRINRATVLLPPAAGGLNDGLLDGSKEYDPGKAANYDVSCWVPDGAEPQRERVWGDGPVPAGWRLACTVELDVTDDGLGRVWRWLVKRSATDEAGAAGQYKSVELDEHNDAARAFAAAMCDRLKLSPDLAAAVTVAAGAHDLGKDRDVWQRSIGNREYPHKRLAKSGHRRPPEQVTHYRHEFGSLLDVEGTAEFKALPSEDARELCRHLIAAHHGRGRPHFPPDEAFDPEWPHDAVTSLAASVPGRFARLQRKYGRWGLAYLESLVRAADVLASRQAEGGGK